MANVPPRVAELIETFDRNIDAYRSQQYNEAQLRREFIDPFFEELGWDVTNIAGNAQAYKDVIHEDAIKVGSATKAPDYSFRIGGVRKFFLEAKKPSIDIKGDPHPAYQLRRYAWSAKLPLSILTDFEEFAVYDCQTRPKQTDKAGTARIMYLNYKEYVKRWSDIETIFSKDAIYKGSFDKFAVSTKAKRGTTTVDKEFLEEIEKWREQLAKIIAYRNRALTVPQINFAVQRTIDRIIFLRMAEDRGIEHYGQLQMISSGDRTYPRLCELFEKADHKYNSGLFYFQKEPGRPEGPDELTLNLAVDDNPLKYILHSLYYPQCPYEFSVLPAEILGNVYEQFLGKVIRITPGHRAVVEEKPEVKKAGGVYYTPAYIVDYIVKNTVGKLLECHCEEPALQATQQSQKFLAPSTAGGSPKKPALSTAEGSKPLTPKQISNLRILDPACGSGSFLLGAYTCLLNYHRDWYVENNPKKHTKKIYQGKGGQWYLTIAEKKQILLNNIFGVDIDSQAVEVTKLSLLLKVLENESQETLRLFHERALPDLGNNIKCGNSLIGPDFFEDKDPDSIDPEEYRRINPFDWKAEFPHIFKAKNPGFNAVIGNPPYRKERDSKELISELKQSSYGKKYYMGKMDFWYFFLHRAMDLTKANGYISFIVPSYWLKSTGSSKLIKHIKSECSFLDVVDIGKNRVFENVGGQHMTFVLAKNTSHQQLSYQRYASKGLTPFEISQVLFEKSQAHSSLLTLDNSKIYTPDNKIDFERSLHTSLLQKFASSSFFLEGQDKIFLVSQGIVEAPDIVSSAMAKKANKPDLAGCGVFVLSLEEFASYEFNKQEKKFLKPYLRAADVRRYYHQFTGYYVFYIGSVENRHIASNRKLYPNIIRHLNQYKKFITSSNAPYGIHRTRKSFYFTSEKLLCPNMFDKPCFTYCPEESYVNFAFNVVVPNAPLYSLKYLLAVLNSSLGAFWFNINGKKRGVNNDVGVAVMRRFPVHSVDFSNPTEKAKHDKIVKLVDRILDLHKRLTKAKVPAEKTRIQRQINTTDKQIDKLVYELYNLTSEEIAIVEGKK